MRAARNHFSMFTRAGETKFLHATCKDGVFALTRNGVELRFPTRKTQMAAWRAARRNLREQGFYEAIRS